MKIKFVGFFSDLQYGFEGEPTLRSCLLDKEPKYKEKIINYLSEGILMIATPELVSDILSSDKIIIGSPDVMTDGIWAWPKDLIYYLKKYNVCLPDKFICHMKENDWHPPAEDEIDINELEY